MIFTEEQTQAYTALSTDLTLILSKEPEAFKAIAELVNQIAKTYSDKYQSPVIEIVNTKALLLGKDGKQANIHCALKYLQRFLSEGFEKSNNPTDLLKAIHYLIFEYQRMKKFNL